MIKLKNVSKQFGQVTAVDNISFSVGKGEVIGFLGPNGAGKTTTMRMLTGFLRPSSGEVSMGGTVNPDKDRVKAAMLIGYLPENNPLYSEMTVGEYLKFIGSTKSKSSNTKDIIKVCGVDNRLDEKIENLSRGYKQRVGLAAAIIGDPEILILDEPTSGLDPNQVVEIRGLIKELGKKKTVILSTHILQEVEAMCTRVIIINKGSIVYDDKVPKRKGKLEKIFHDVTMK